MRTTELENLFANLLEENSLEDILEKFDLTGIEVLTLLYDKGLVDEEILESLNSTYDH